MALAPSRPPLSFGRAATSLTLEELLGEARDEYAAELDIPLTVDQPPNLYSIGPDGQRVYQAAEGAQIGLSMSSQMYRRIGHPADDYGNVFPVARALDDLRGWCRGRHLEARSGPWEDHARDVELGTALWDRLAGSRPLCARLAYYAVAYRVPLSRLAASEELELPEARRLLLGALRHMWDQRIEWAHADDSGVSEVLAQQRRERNAARARADAARAPGVLCRHCSRPYDSASQEPCPGSEADRDALSLYAEAGFTLLCSPADPS